jgi:hypothetical protein
MKYTQEQQKQGAELMKALVEKAWENASFKDQLVKNPTAAIEEFTGKGFTMPEGKKVVVEDQTDNSVIYLNIPAEPNLDELELSAEQLEKISGGLTPTFIAVGIGFGAGVAFMAGAAAVAAVLKD